MQCYIGEPLGLATNLGGRVDSKGDWSTSVRCRWVKFRDIKPGKRADELNKARHVRTMFKVGAVVVFVVGRVFRRPGPTLLDESVQVLVRRNAVIDQSNPDGMGFILRAPWLAHFQLNGIVDA